MTLELTNREANAIKELIYSKIDQIGGYELLDTNITNVLTKIIENKE
jgi:hypothetical protein